MRSNDDKRRGLDPQALRREAVNRLRERRPDLAAMNPDDVRALVYELEVHQAELEVQNEELRRTQQALAEARDRYRDLYEFAPIGYVTLDAQGTISQINLAGAALYGRVRGWLVGRRFEAVLQPADRDAGYLVLRDVAANGVQKASELRLARPDGEVRWVRAEVALQLGTEPEPGGFRVTLSDITERKHMEDALREADRRKDEFLAMLGHELRNPLAALCSALQVQRLAGSGDAVSANAREIMERQTSYLVRLVDDLLDLSRITRGKIELRRERVDLAEVVREVVESNRSMIDKAGCRLAVDVAPQPLVVDADAVRLAQVLSNLLNNAAKYTGNGGEIHLTVTRDGDTGVIAVRDNGRGIAADMLPRVFDMFTQARDLGAGGQRGLGIGLTLVRSLVGLHGGAVEARSEGLGKGSAFVVRLPLVASGDTAVTPTSAPADSPLSFRRLLVVDDNRDVADGTGTLLRLLGAEVRVVYDGRSALETCANFHPTEIFLDLGMPDMDGFEIARRLRAQFPNEGFRLIALTGWGQSEHREKARAAGFDLHLTKPVDVRALQAVLDLRS